MTRPNIHNPDRKPSTLGSRRPGGGRKRKLDTLEGVAQSIAGLVPSRDNGILQWTTKSLRELTEELNAAGYGVSRNIVSKELQRLGFQVNRNRELPATRQPNDVDSQFEIVDKAASMWLEAGNPIIFLTGGKKNPLNSRVRMETSFEPPYEITRALEYRKEVVVEFLGQKITTFKDPSAEEEKEIKRKKREATTLDLEILTTERDGALFTAAVIEHWWNNLRSPHFPRSDSLLLLTHGGSPDCISPIVWQWAMDRLSKKLGITITIGRLPPATCRFLLTPQPLFSFTWLQFKNISKEEFYFEKKHIKNWHTVKASLLSDPPRACGEIKQIPLIDRNYPRLRRSISKRVRNTFVLHRFPPYGDWNYSFGATGGQR